MKRSEMINKINAEARRQGLSWSLKRRGGNHDIYDLDGTRIPMARHREIADRMAVVIFKQCEPRLGEEWWK